MVAEGYEFEDWALYPIDEPAGDKLALLARVSAWVKSDIPHIRIYANPGTVGLSDLAPGGLIYQLMGVVDLWQPLLGHSASIMGPILNRRAEGEWWLYQTGQAPAKSMVPNCYRKLGWEAATRGATGFGFWSFSDTGGSSAWNDMDGTRPDWAVVYEAAGGGIVPSRRWEAFRRGIREYRALRGCESTSPEVASAKSGCALFRATLTKAFDGLACQ